MGELMRAEIERQEKLGAVVQRYTPAVWFTDDRSGSFTRHFGIYRIRPGTEVTVPSNYPDMKIIWHPEIGSVWQHHNGNIYTVFCLSNRGIPAREKYPLTVTYRNIHTGELYSRRASDWLRSMTELCLAPKI